MSIYLRRKTYSSPSIPNSVKESTSFSFYNNTFVICSSRAYQHFIAFLVRLQYLFIDTLAAQDLFPWHGILYSVSPPLLCLIYIDVCITHLYPVSHDFSHGLTKASIAICHTLSLSLRVFIL